MAMNKTDSLASTDSGGVPAHLMPAATWVCPTCGSTIRTFVPTRVPICKGKAHSVRAIHMEVKQ